MPSPRITLLQVILVLATFVAAQSPTDASARDDHIAAVVSEYEEAHDAHKKRLQEQRDVLLAAFDVQIDRVRANQKLKSEQRVERSTDLQRDRDRCRGSAASMPRTPEMGRSAGIYEIAALKERKQFRGRAKDLAAKLEQQGHQEAFEKLLLRLASDCPAVVEPAEVGKRMRKPLRDLQNLAKQGEPLQIRNRLERLVADAEAHRVGFDDLLQEIEGLRALVIDTKPYKSNGPKFGPVYHDIVAALDATLATRD